MLNRLEKFLQNHGFKLSSVLSNITGTSGRRILDHLADKGHITSTEISSSISKRVKCSTEEIEAAVCGELELFERKLLKHLLEKLDLCERSIANLLEEMEELAALCQVAWAAVKCRNSSFADWFWSHQSKLGKKRLS